MCHKKESPIDCLPNEILIKIISKLCVYDRISCERVCYRWQQLAQIFLADIKAFSFGHHLRICSDLDHKVLDSRDSANRYKSVIKLLDETYLMNQILSFTPQLKCLNVYLRKGESVEIIKKYCSKIECLTLISFEDQVMINAIPMISNFGDTLRHLKICDESRVIRRNGLEGLMIGMLSHCPRLQVLHLFRIYLNEKSCQMLGQEIKEISTQLGYDSIEGLIKSKIYLNLESLLIRNSIINATRIQTICESFINLRKLFIDSYSDCDDFTYLTLIARMKRLEHLEIIFYSKFYDNFECIDHILSHIFVNCIHLTKISLSGCVNVCITDESLTNMRVNCPQLRSVNFWKFGSMTGVSFKGIIALASMPQLRSLILDSLFFNCNLKLIDTNFKNLFEISPELNFIYLFVHQMTRI